MDKKKLIGLVVAVLIAAGGLFLGVDFKSYVCAPSAVELSK